MSIEEKLIALREEWKKSDEKSRAIIEVRAKLLKMALKNSSELYDLGKKLWETGS